MDEPVGPGMDGYQILLRELKLRIRTARLQAALAVNQELILLYWGIGREILERQAREGWGSRVIDRLSADLRRDFPDMTGLSARNLKYVRALAEAHPDHTFVQQVVARLPWGHVIRLLEHVKDVTRREWYARQAIEHGWSRNVLVHQIESNLYERQGKALTNFSRTLPAVQSELAQQLIKDPYSFDFLTLGPDLLERDLEREFAGKMNFYLWAVDEQLRHSDDGPSIGIILCKSRNELIVEYALRDTAKPMGVSQHRLATALPDQLQGELPTLEEFARELPYLSLVAVRIEIERVLRLLMISRGLEPRRGFGIGGALRELKESSGVPSGTDAFLQTLATMNEAVHGIEVEPAVAAEALRVASEFLAELRRLAAE